MPSQAVVDLVVDASGTQASLNAQLRLIADRAEASAPPITLHVNIDNRSFTSIGQQINNGVTGPLGDADRAMRDTEDSSGSLGSALGRVGGVARTASAGFLGLAGTVGNLPGLLAGVVTSLQNIAPAGAAAVSGFVAIKAATATLKIGLTGVSDAISAVFDPDADPKKTAEAMKNLSDNAQDFVKQLQTLKPALDSIRLDVQDRLFRGLDTTLKQTAKVTLPDLTSAARSFADSFNDAARGAASSARQLAADGTLGSALTSGTNAFEKLERVPGQVLTAVGQLAAAGGPLLNRFALSVADLADSISTKLTAAFKSGGLQDAVGGAGDAIAQLGRIGVNVFETLGNIISVAGEQGDGLFGSLERITQAMADVTATKGFQDVLTSLMEVAQTLSANILPLVATALSALAPVITTLAPVVQEILDLLGKQLSDTITELAPLFQLAAETVASLLTALEPLIPLAGTLITAILPVLTVLLSSLNDVFIALAPTVQVFADQAGAQLTEFFVQLTPLLTIVIQGLAQLLIAILPLVNTAMPGLIAVSMPVIVAVTGIAQAINILIAVSERMAVVLQATVGPALSAIGALVRGDFSGAWASARTAVSNAVSAIVSVVGRLVSYLPSSVQSALSAVVARFRSGWDSARSATSAGIDRVVALVRSLPGRARSALGSLGSVLYDSGRSLIGGFVDGMLSKLKSAVSAAASIVGKVRDYFPFSPAKTGPFSGRGYTLYSGQALVGDFAKGILSQRDTAQRAIDNVLGAKATAPNNGRGTAAPTGSLISSTGAALARQGASPNVFVYLGNELINNHIQTRIDQSNLARDRQAAQGVRV